jgi:hypothetical protein
MLISATASASAFARSDGCARRPILIWPVAGSVGWPRRGRPDHSTFSKSRHGRFCESDLLRKLFETVVTRCMTEGIVGGEAFAVDASIIVADAHRRRGVAKIEDLEPTSSRAVAEYLSVLDDRAFSGPTPSHVANEKRSRCSSLISNVYSGSVAAPWPERSQGRVPIGRHRPQSAETGETHPLPGAGLRPVRRRGAALLRWQPPLTHIVLASRQGSSTQSIDSGLPLSARLASSSRSAKTRAGSIWLESRPGIPESVGF